MHSGIGTPQPISEEMELATFLDYQIVISTCYVKSSKSTR